MNRPIKIFIYSDYPSRSLNISEVREYLARFGFQVEDRGNFIDYLKLSDARLSETAERLSGAVVDNISSDLVKLATPDRARFNSEVSRLRGREGMRGVLYDGYWLERIFHRALSERIPLAPGDDYLQLLFTSRLFGTFEDRRYHARVVLMGAPSLISTSGLVEAPAKPREYYYIKGGLIQSGKDLSVLDEMYRGRYVEYDDPKISSILCSYALQVVFYHMTGQAFCDDEECCLYNSHWQEDVLRVQHDGELCERCLELINVLE
jgi:putative metallopeptidase DUF6775